MNVHDAEKNDHENKDPLKNVNLSKEYGLLKSRNLFRRRDSQHMSVLSSGKWLQFVKKCSKVSDSELSNESQKMHKKVISLTTKTLSSPSVDCSQGTLQFTMGDNETPRFVFKLENQKYIYVASLSSNVEDKSVLDYSYMIHLQRGDSSSSSSSSSHVVGRIKVSTLFSGLNERNIERQFVLFCINGEKKNRVLSEKAKKNQSVSTCSWDDEFQEPSFENNFPTNLEALAVLVKQEFLEEETGGWGLKFLKKLSMFQTESESSRSLTSMDVVIPSGIHGGPEDGPLSLIERLKSKGKCDCGGWDLGCSLTLLEGQPQCSKLFELFIEGSKHETPKLSILNVREGLYSVTFQKMISTLQSFSIVLAFIHSQKHRLWHI